ncbi:MAG: hypothetical protein EZS28_051919, partial [Streblomastix strix]
HNDPVFEISLPIFVFFTHLIQDYLVRIKRSPLPIVYKLKREIKLRASNNSEIVENTSYAFGIKFNSLSGVVTSSELLLTGNVFDKLSISGTKDDAEKRALKRAERRREEIQKQNEKRRRLEEAAKKGRLYEEEKRAQRKGVDNTIPSARIVVALPAITVETKVHLEGELVEQTIRILEESPEEIVEVKKPKNQPQVASKTIEQQLPPIFIEALKIDDIKIDLIERKDKKSKSEISIEEQDLYTLIETVNEERICNIEQAKGNKKMMMFHYENQVRKLGLLIATIPATLNLIQLIVPAKPQSNNKVVENLEQS